MSKTVVADLQGVLDLAVKKGEGQAAFAERLARAANDENKMADEDWETLDQDTQLWVNAALEALKSGGAVPLPTGIDFLIPLEEEEGEETGEVSAEEEEKVEPQVEAAKPAKKAKAEKAEKPIKKETKAEADGPARGPKGKFAADAKIKILAEKNPFRDGTKCYGWFSKFEDGMTVSEAVAAGAPRNHIRWAHTLGHIRIG